MRVTTKGARTFFLLMLTVLAILGIYQCFTMANAVNVVPTFKLRARAVPADSVSIYGGSLHAEHVDSVIVVTLRAGDKIVTDTIQGAASIVGIVDDTLRLDTDSTGAYAIITFGGWGGGIRWNQSSDAMEFTNDFTTWTEIGTGGSSTTNADSLFHIPAFVRPQTDGYVLKFDADGDSLYLSEDATGAAGDSNAVIYSTNRVDRYTDSAQYFGNTGDSTFVVYEGVRTTTNSDDLIKFLTQIYLWEDVPDSIPVTWGSMMAQVGATGSGDITGVIVNHPLIGGAASGDVSISLDETIIAVNPLTSGGGAEIYITPSGVTIPNILEASGSLSLSSTRAWSLLYTDALSDVDTIPIGVAGTIPVSMGVSTVPTFQSLSSIIDTLFTVDDAAHDTMWANTPGYLTSETGDISSVVAGNGLTGGATSGAATLDIGGSWSIRVTADSIHVKQLDGDSITAGTVADARIATTLLRDSELKDSIHAARTISNVWTITGDWVNTTTPWADNEVANNLTVDDAGIASTITRDAELEDSLDAYLIASVIVSLVEDSLDMYYDTTKSVARIREVIEDSLDNYYDTTQIVLRIKQIVRDSLFNNSNNFFKTAGNGLTSSTSTVNVVAGANGLTVNADSIYIDTTKIARFEELRANWLLAWTDSTLGLGSGAGLTISNAITLGTDITDDTLVVDYYPEPNNVVLANSLMPQYDDSISIYGVIDSLLGNTLHFRDSTLNTHGLRRRGFQMTVSHPMRVDSLRYVIVEGLVKDSSATNTMWLKGMLRTTTFTMSCLDSNAAANIKDYDSLGGDWGDAAAIRRFVLTGGAVTQGTPWYLLITARHGSGTAWNWAEVWRIRFVYSRTAL